MRAWDFAGTKKRPGCRSGLDGRREDGARADKRFYIADVVRVRETPGKVRQRLINTANQDGAAVGIRIPKDSGQAGIAQAETTLPRSRASSSAPWRRPLEGGAGQAAIQPSRGRQRAAPAWVVNEAFLEELGMFPAASHDDQVDAAADAFNELAGCCRARG